MMRAAAASVANLCIFPLQDVLGLGSEARMNTPAAGAGNWTWRYRRDALDSTIAAELAALMEMTDRDRYTPPDAVRLNRSAAAPSLTIRDRAKLKQTTQLRRTMPLSGEAIRTMNYVDDISVTLRRILTVLPSLTDEERSASPTTSRLRTPATIP